METKSTPGLSGSQDSAWRLLVLHCPDLAHAGRAVVLASERHLRLVRGSGADGAFGLEDAEVSREHAELVRGADGWRLRDLESRNGTFVCGRRITEHELIDGDVVRAGGTLLLWQHLDASACERLLRGRKPPSSSPIVGASHEIVRLHEEIGAAGQSGLPVLIVGESGAGKELVARALHEAAGGGPFVPVNCAALPEALAESELFGHARGAFTGASAESSGLFGHADGGTLFLDEIGEMQLELQAKLLRAIATGEVRGIGQRNLRHVRVRVIAATNIDIDGAVRAGRFRGDLYARISGARISVPALRQRREDILALARHFLSPARVTIQVDAAEALLGHGWPWNVRELEHMMIALSPAARELGCISLADLPPHIQSVLGARRTSQGFDRGVQALLGIRRDAVPNRDELARALTHFEGNVSRVAAFFERERRQIYRWAEQLGLSPATMRGPTRGPDAE